MKKKSLWIAVLSLLMPLLTFSQEDNTTKLPAKKDFMFEINIRPFGNTDASAFESLQTKYRLSNRIAMRLGLQFAYKRNSTTGDDYSADANLKPNLLEKSFFYGVRPGIEYRILPNSKISPYVGLEFSYMNKMSSANYEEYVELYDHSTGQTTYHKIETQVEGAWRNIENVYYSNYYGHGWYSITSYDKEQSFTSYGLNLLFGTDFFVSKKFYMGFEMRVGGYEIRRDKKITIYEEGLKSGEVVILKPKYTTLPAKTSSNFGYYINSLIKLGLHF